MSHLILRASEAPSHHPSLNVHVDEDVDVDGPSEEKDNNSNENADNTNNADNSGKKNKKKLLSRLSSLPASPVFPTSLSFPKSQPRAKSLSGASPRQARFPESALNLNPPPPLLSPAQTARKIQRLSRLEGSNLAGTSFLEISPPATPVETLPSPSSPSGLHDFQNLVSKTRSAGPPAVGLPSMASGSVISKARAANEAPLRTSSMDSATSTTSSRTPSQQSTQDPNNDVAGLIRAAGSPEAVIQYLLKEKQSQSQQNAQLWRLVDKQRAMILGLNKDLERALKDKERYRKKLKEVTLAPQEQTKPDASSVPSTNIHNVEITISKETKDNGPQSPSTDSVKNSPVGVSMAPYPITPPADQVQNEPASKVSELLDPTHAMPIPSEHALDHFDHEEQDRVAEDAKKAASAMNDLPIQLGLPPSRSHPSEPPRMPPPAPPTGHPPSVSIIEATPLVDQGIAQFPPPSAPPARKPPPAPLQLRKDSNTIQGIPLDDDDDSESDYDSLLEVNEIPLTENRGRRRTREEDDREREVIVQQEAEARSLSKKSKKGSQLGTPISAVESRPKEAGTPMSPSMMPQPLLVRDNIPASLTSILKGQEPEQMLPPMLSPGLPASPRPMGMRSLVGSPPLSPGLGAAPLSPRAPRQPIPLPPNAPRSHGSPIEAPKLTTPRPQHITKPTPDEQSDQQRESPIERNHIFQGFVTEEYPNFLLPPNALPSVSVKVASSRMKPSRASLLSLTQLEEDPVFTLAILSRSEGTELWRVEKDTASLGKLDQRMKQCPSFTAKTPDRSLFAGHAPAKLDARRTVLNQYLEELLNTPLDLPTATDLCKYLSTNALPPNTDDPSLFDEKTQEVAAQREGPGGRPFKNGYLTKRGKNFGGWKARYFVLDGPNLKYYETPGGAHLGTIKLQSAQIGKQSHQSGDGSPGGSSNGDELDNQYRHAFLVLEPKKKDSSSHVKHVLCAESDQERDQWVEALLRWIDYKDAKDDEKSGSHSHSSHTHSYGTNSKKKMQGHGKSNGQRHDSDETLGMSYNTTKQGNLPDGVPPPQRRGTTSPDLPDKAPAPSYTISAPRDPHIISDSASWGSKASSLALPGPSIEEKKQRKRSFFGFGPKTRSSSDDQDVSYNSSGGSTPQPQSEYRSPVRPVFGAPLAEAVRYCGPSNVNVPLPAVVYRCIQYLDLKNAILEEGIFRLSGSNVIIKQLRERFNIEGDIDLLTDETYYDIHAVASLLKLYLRELPTTILTRDLHMQFVSVIEMANHREKIMALSELVQRLPLANETLLKYLIAFLIKIINHADMNKMTVRNVGIVFSPTLNIPAPIFALLLQNYSGIFGIEPEEYELSPLAATESRESQPRRPSTAGMTESPHRQRVMEQMQQRSTPTPPPMAAMSNMRATATPPPRQTYEPQYLAQQGPGAQLNSRSAYENAFASPAGYDPTALQAPNMKQPTYDRPHFGYAAPYEQDYSGGSLEPPTTSKSKRRESSMFMGNVMNQQGPNSRLREETRM